MTRVVVERRRVVFVGVILLAAQTSTWWLIGQHRLVQSVPEMAVHDFSMYEAAERKYRFQVNSPIRIVACDDIRRQLGDAGVSRLASALKRFNVTVTESARGDRAAPQLCFEVGWQSPLVAKAETWLGPQFAALGGNGFDHYYLHLFGGWVHLWSRMAWVS